MSEDSDDTLSLCSNEPDEAPRYNSSLKSTVTLRCGKKKMRLSMTIHSHADEDEDEDDDDNEDDKWFWEDATMRRGVHLKRFWVHAMFTRRPKDGEFVRVCVPYRRYPEMFFKYFRMTVETYDYILKEVQDILMKKSRRVPISPTERLAVTLRFLSTGLIYQALGDSFLMSPCTIGLIVPEVCHAIYTRLVKKHMPIPSRDDFLKIAQDFEEQWDFPHCIGALDGKHVRIKCPPNSGTMFFNYKRFFSIVMQAVADSHCRFLFIDVGAYGKQSDGGAFDASLLNSFLQDTSNFPEDSIVEGMTMKVPYIFVVDDAYPLRWNMMKPYSRPMLTKEEHIFNGRLSRARRCVECSFGILANKWRILLKDIETSVDHACVIVKCLTVLHNIVIDREGVDAELLGKVERRIDTVQRAMKLDTGRRYNRSPADAVKLRESLTDYFQSDFGFVPWQDRYVK